jgi:hypothetical protein
VNGLTSLVAGSLVTNEFCDKRTDDMEYGRTYWHQLYSYLVRELLNYPEQESKFYVVTTKIGLDGERRKETFEFFLPRSALPFHLLTDRCFVLFWIRSNKNIYVSIFKLKPEMEHSSCLLVCKYSSDSRCMIRWQQNAAAPQAQTCSTTTRNDDSIFSSNLFFLCLFVESWIMVRMMLWHDCNCCRIVRRMRHRNIVVIVCFSSIEGFVRIVPILDSFLLKSWSHPTESNFVEPSLALIGQLRLLTTQLERHLMTLFVHPATKATMLIDIIKRDQCVTINCLIFK